MGKRTTAEGSAPKNEPVRKVKEEIQPPVTGEDQEAAKELPPPEPLHDFIEYDVTEITAFLNKVFHVEPRPDEHIVAQCSPKAPRGYPAKSVDILLKSLSQTQVAMPAYFGTSTVGLTDGDLRHVKAAFKRFSVLVLDDIGTKIPEDKLPEGLAETYAITSSKGNQQLGFVLKEPIENYDEAQLLITLFADAGLTDIGGCMPCKKVRLPCGVNGKSGEKKTFPVTLDHMDGDYWTPQELLDAAGIDVNWERARVDACSKSGRTRRLGASAWSPIPLFGLTADGLYDPVLEWLYGQGMVIADENPEIIEIQCPWHAEHTDEKETAGYFPLGRGDLPNVRGFHCFHGHCAGRKGRALVEWVAEQDGPRVPVKEADPELYSRYVLDMTNDSVWDIKRDGPPTTFKIKMLKQVTSSTELPRGDKAPLRVNPVDIWTKLPSCVRVEGQAYDASCRDKIVVDRHGTQRVNIFHMPMHPPVTIDMKHVEPFKHFLAYLIPDKEQHDYFLDWLSCKAQHPEFRGAAMVMVAKAEGTGRGTLMQLIGKLFGQRNVRNITMDEMLGSQWTDWRASLFVHVDESMAMEDPAGARRAYDRLKELIDPMTTEGIVNVKYGGQMWVKMCSSMLLFSNHEDALYVADNTRRFYGVRNPDIPAPPVFFKKLREWMGDFTMPTQWERHVWAWLLERKVDVAKMTAPPPESEAMKKIKHASKSLLDAVIDGAIATWPSTIVPVKTVMDSLSYYEAKGLPKAWRTIAKGKLAQQLYSLAHLNKVEHEGRKFTNTVCANGDVRKIRSTIPMTGADMGAVFIEKDAASEAFKSFDRAQQRIAINQWLEENEYHF